MEYSVGQIVVDGWSLFRYKIISIESGISDSTYVLDPLEPTCLQVATTYLKDKYFDQKNCWWIQIPTDRGNVHLRYGTVDFFLSVPRDNSSVQLGRNLNLLGAKPSTL